MPLEVVARHEAGHAVMAWHLGCYVRWIIWGRDSTGSNYGEASFLLPSDVQGKVLIQMAGVLALYLHDVAEAPDYGCFRRWGEANLPIATSGVGDWVQILELTGKPIVGRWNYFLEHAVRPHFSEAADILASKREDLDALTQFLLERPGGVGPRTLRRFREGRPPSRWATLLDWRRVRLESKRVRGST